MKNAKKYQKSSRKGRLRQKVYDLQEEDDVASKDNYINDTRHRISGYAQPMPRKSDRNKNKEDGVSSLWELLLFIL